MHVAEEGAELLGRPDLPFGWQALWRVNGVGDVAGNVAPAHGVLEGAVEDGVDVLDGLAHERAHQAGHHHRLVLLTRVLRVGFPWLPAARLARDAVARLVELAADDTAARSQGRRQVAAALATLGEAPVPEATLGVAGVSARERVRRLTTPRQHEGALTLLAGLLMLALPLAAQVVAVALPLARVAGVPLCPLG